MMLHALSPRYAIAALVASAAMALDIRAQTDSARARIPMLLGAQATLIMQRLAPFEASYVGPNSLTPDGDTQFSHSYGLYFGIPLARHLQGYVDAEMLRGRAVGRGRGLGGVINGDVIAPEPGEPLSAPFVARVFLRYVVPLTQKHEETARGINQLPGNHPIRRLEIKAGRMAASDDFDPNRYGSSARSQFMNWGLFTNTAWDYPADARGYATGATIALLHPAWSLRLGSYLMPAEGATTLGSQLRRSRGDDIQATVTLGGYRTVVRLFAFRNVGRMSGYRSALSAGIASRTVPSLDSVDRFGMVKRGGGVNIEQPLSEHGNFGIMLRAGWNDGRSDGFATSEVDRHVSLATQYRLKRFNRRPQDFIGAGVARHWLSTEHHEFLAAGGSGFFLGDGGLQYGAESIAELYYRAHVGNYLQAGPCIQIIRHPGYNRDRGTVVAIAIRVHVEY